MNDQENPFSRNQIKSDLTAVDSMFTPDVVKEIQEERENEFELMRSELEEFESCTLSPDILELKKSLETVQKLSNDVPISSIIRDRIESAGERFYANDNISKYIKPLELDLLKEEVASKFKEVLKSLVIDVDNDHNTKDTCNRVAKMFCEEIFSGRYDEMPQITGFPNDSNYDQLYVTGPISIRSTCAHHFMPIKGKAYIGVFPGKNVIGLSKFNRLSDWIASRPQIQEEMTVQIADLVEKETQAEGVAVLIQAEHFCLTHRGFREHESDMTTSVMRGTFRTDQALKQEFLQIVSRMK